MFNDIILIGDNMSTIDQMKEELKGNKKKIILPEGNSYEINFESF